MSSGRWLRILPRSKWRRPPASRHSTKGDGFETEEPEALREWLAKAWQVLDAMAPEARTRLADWLDLFKPGSDPETEGRRIAFRLAAIGSGLKRAEAPIPDASLATALAGIDDSTLASRMADLTAHATRPGFLRRLLPTWRNLVSRVGAFAADMGGDASPAFLTGLRRASELEADVRPHRRALAEALSELRLPPAGRHANAGEVLDCSAEVLTSLETVRTAAALVLNCPVTEACEAAVRRGTSVAWQDVRDRFLRALVRHGLREASKAALKSLIPWFPGTWLADCENAVRQGGADHCAYPAGRERARLACGLSEIQGEGSRSPVRCREGVRGALRQLESQLLLLPEADLDGVVRRTLRREALLAIKGRLETNHPELLFGREELEGKVSALSTLDTEMRSLNRELLGHGIDAGKLGSEAAWDDMTRLAGPRRRRLRELLDGGPEIGLMHLRPVWLMNPDVASRVLPLKAGLFDLVVYDEASQMPVEHAVPTLYRAKRAVVSGDEKQMPPSSFFSGAVEDDEDDEVDEMDEPATEAERLAQEEGWNRREVKDCPDLLQLARAVLSTAIAANPLPLELSRADRILERRLLCRWAERAGSPARGGDPPGASN